MTHPLHTAEQAAATLTLPALLDMRQAAPLRDLLLTALAAEAPIRLDGAAVERLTTPCAQVLLAAAADASRRHLPFQLCNPSPALGAGFTALGLKTTLNDWSAA